MASSTILPVDLKLEYVADPVFGPDLVPSTLLLYDDSSVSRCSVKLQTCLITRYTNKLGYGTLSSTGVMDFYSPFDLDLDTASQISRAEPDERIRHKGAAID